MGATIFVIDDDAAQLQLTEEILTKKCHYKTISALGGKAAIERFLLRIDPQPDLILLDLIMPDVSGVEVVRAIRRSDPNIPIILLSPQDQHAMVMEGIRAGANDCLQKPVNLHYLKVTVEKHLQRETMRAELGRLSRYQRAQFDYEDILGKSEAIQHCITQAKEASGQSLPLCFEGEEGVGKELFARVVHSHGAHNTGPFMAVECSRSHPFFDMMEPGGQANEAKLPFEFTSAVGGTVLLRHLEKLPMAAQEELVQFLLNARSYARSPWLHVRFMASCSQSLAHAYRKGLLHEKLYYYFSAQVISIPALRERREDIVSLATYYLKRFTATQTTTIREVAPDAASILMQYPWPGNITELITLMQRAAYYARGGTLDGAALTTLLEHPHLPQRGPVQVQTLKPDLEKESGRYSLLTHGGEVKPFDQVEAEIIRFAIEHYGGKMTEVAKKLGIGRSTLYRKMQDYKLRQHAA